MDELAELLEGAPDPAAGVAYRMPGSLSEADDAVQEAWLRLSRLRELDPAIFDG